MGIPELPRKASAAYRRYVGGNSNRHNITHRFFLSYNDRIGYPYPEIFKEKNEINFFAIQTELLPPVQLCPRQSPFAGTVSNHQNMGKHRNCAYG
ncbi:hypothetical protein LWM68_07805 [Niabella sp. W65]|nr:hypothetical protein [Niabella sp. W65]MCH7362678.1 hypothetical protein [Niabella sp. W65]ULT38633.1 hypothetical protein KRR40_26465 [Niabella sp. I65]